MNLSLLSPSSWLLRCYDTQLPRQLFGLLLAGFAVSVSAQTADDLLRGDIEQTQPADTYSLLPAGELMVPAVVADSVVPIRKGVAVILSDTGMSPLSHNGIAALADELNQFGWVTISIAAAHFADTQSTKMQEMTKGENAPQSQEQADMQEKADMNADTQMAAKEDMPMPSSAQPMPLAAFLHESPFDQAMFEQQQQRLLQTLIAAEDKAREYTGFFLVIAEGTAAALLLNMYGESKHATPDAMVSVGAFWPERQINLTIPEWLAVTPMPVLDVHSHWHNHWVQQIIENKATSARKSLKVHYRQRKLAGLSLQETPQFAELGKEIYGWLTQLGW